MAGLGAFLLSVEKMGSANMEWATSISKWSHDDSSGGLWASLCPVNLFCWSLFILYVFECIYTTGTSEVRRGC